MTNDTEYETVQFTEVRERDDAYDVTSDEGWSFTLMKQYDDEPPHGAVPHVGSIARFYGRGFGFTVRGVTLWDATANRWQVVYYRTDQQERDKWQAEQIVRDTERRHQFENGGRAALDAQYDTLPDVFKRRIDKFRANNPDFRVEYEGYEMFCCTEAVKLARHWGTVEAAKHYTSLATSETFSADRARWDREWEEQKAIDRAAGLDDGHSGNTHGAAVALAFWYLEHPENVERMHGALSPLVGSEEYGDVPRST